MSRHLFKFTVYTVAGLEKSTLFAQTFSKVKLRHKVNLICVDIQQSQSETQILRFLLIDVLYRLFVGASEQGLNGYIYIFFVIILIFKNPGNPVSHQETGRKIFVN